MKNGRFLSWLWTQSRANSSPRDNSLLNREFTGNFRYYVAAATTVARAPGQDSPLGGMRVEDRVALSGIAIGLGATVAAMALPFAYPDAAVTLWRCLFWGGLGITGASAATLAYDLRFKRAPKDNSAHNQTPPQLPREKRIRFEFRPVPSRGRDARFRRRTKSRYAQSQAADILGTYEFKAAFDRRNNETLRNYQERFAADVDLIFECAAQLEFVNPADTAEFYPPNVLGDIEEIASRISSISKYVAARQ